MTQEQLITLDNLQYRLSDLSDEAKTQLTNLRYADAELQQLHGQLALAQTARFVYSRELAKNLPEKKAPHNKKKDVVTIDDNKYNIEDFSEQAKAQMGNIRFAEEEIQRLTNQQALVQTARAQYVRVMAEAIKGTQPVTTQ